MKEIKNKKNFFKKKYLKVKNPAFKERLLVQKIKA